MKNILFKQCLYFISLISEAMTVIASILLPKILDWYYLNVLGKETEFGVMIFLYISAIPFLLIGLSVVKLSKRLLKGKVFYKTSMRELKIISICALIEFVLYLVGAIFFYHNLLCLVVMAGTLMVFIISSIVREIIGSGIELQEEADLVI